MTRRTNASGKAPNYHLRDWSGYMMKRAIAFGWLVRPGACEACGVECRPEGHHHNYAQPWNISWLCRQCHKNEHKRLRAAGVSGEKIATADRVKVGKRWTFVLLETAQ